MESMGIRGFGKMDMLGNRSLLLVIARLAALLACNLFGYSGRGADFYVAPKGASTGDGSINNPWDLYTALRHPPSVQPGDTLWLRGGAYRRFNRVTKFYSTLQGSEDNPIWVRRYPGERAVIDGNVTQAAGGAVNYVGFEIMNTFTRRLTTQTGPFPTSFWASDGLGKLTDLAVSGFDLRAPNVKLINLIIHDCIGGGIGINRTATNAEIHGVVCFYNGWQGGDRGHGHGLYAQNTGPGVSRVDESIFFANYALGIHGTGSSGTVDNLDFEGNVVFHNSILSRSHQGNLLIGAVSGQAKEIRLVRNFIYEDNPSGSDGNLGYVGGLLNGLLQNNYFATKVSFSPNNSNLQLLENTFVDAATLETPGNLVEVRTNKYEHGRANIIVYNWQGLDEVSADISGVLSVGADYEVRNAHDVLGPPVLSANYDGAPILLPMTNLFVAKPFLVNPPAPVAPRFGVFILRLQNEPSTNMPPLVSAVTNHVIYQNKTKAFRLTFSDPDFPAEFLNISVASSDPILLPPNRVRFSGTKGVRTVTLAPATNQVGTSVVSVAISDGLRATKRSVTLTVKPIP